MLLSVAVCSTINACRSLGGNPYLVLHFSQVLQNNTVLMKNEDAISKNLMVWFSTIARKKKHHLTNHQINQAVLHLANSQLPYKKNVSPSLNNHGLTSLLCVCQRYHYPVPGITRMGFGMKFYALHCVCILNSSLRKTANLVIKLQSIQASERIRGKTCTALKHDFYFQLSGSTSLPSGLRFKFRFHVTF